MFEIIYQCDIKYGAPMGRSNVGSLPLPQYRGPLGHSRVFKCDQVRIYDRKVPMIGSYDKGGAYWGIGSELRVKFTKDLKYIEFYRI